MTFSFHDLDENPVVRFYAQGAPPDPIQESKKSGIQNWNAATGYTLFHQSLMPFGAHAGKIMEQVPARYLLWLCDQPWASSKKWHPIKDYVDRHRQYLEEKAEGEPEEKAIDYKGQWPGAPWIQHDAKKIHFLCTQCGSQVIFFDFRGKFQRYWLSKHILECDPEKPNNDQAHAPLT